MQRVEAWHDGCEMTGMNIWIILFAVQAIATLVALLRESSNDAQFDGDKLEFRS